MLEKIGNFAGAAIDKAGEIHDTVHSFWGRYNPDLYSSADARYALSRIYDSEYLLGTNKINPQHNAARSKIWSLPPEVLEAIKGIVKDAGHVHILPFILGTYNMADQSMRMNEVCVTDPYMAYLMATGGLEGFVAPFLRGLYYAGRSSWWRHESIHARHHHQMAYFLDATDDRKRNWDGNWNSESQLEEAALTVHEAGIEELLTRWQALKESRGMREKAVSSLALLFYLEYAPFTGVRNMFIDGKEKTLDLLQDGMIRIPAKIATVAGIAVVPYYLNGQTHFVEALGDTATQLLPMLTDKQVEGAIRRGHMYVFVAALSALFSTKEKGAFTRREVDGQRLPTTEYKFPYVYNPVTSVARSIGFLRYLSRVWDQIPNYRLVESPKDIDVIKREVDDRLSGKMSDEQHQFTMQTVEEALRPFEGQGRSTFPQDAYLKGTFTPAMYLKLRELYSAKQS